MTNIIKSLLDGFSFYETTPLISVEDCASFFEKEPVSLYGYDYRKHSTLENLFEAFYAISSQPLSLQYKLNSHYMTRDGYLLGTNVWYIAYTLERSNIRSPIFPIFGKTPELAGKYALQFATGLRVFQSDADRQKRNDFKRSFDVHQQNNANKWATDY
jgi:hypothetical protein